MTIEICVQTMRGYDDTLEIARWCEREGIPALAVADHYLSDLDMSSNGFDQLVVLGGIARETSTIQLCTLVSPLTFRHPAVHLKAAVTLDQMSRGRFSLGVGAGWMELEHESFGLELYPMAERFQRLAETLGYLRAALDGAGEGFQGRHYRLAAFVPQPQPSNLRLIVGGGGARKTPELAGRFADEFNVFPDNTPMAGRVQRFEASAREAGRDPAAVLVSSAFPAVVTADAEAAGDLVRRRSERSKVTPERMLEMLDGRGIPHGTPDEAAKAYAALAEAGVTRVYLQVASDSLDDIAGLVEAARRAASLATG